MIQHKYMESLPEFDPEQEDLFARAPLLKQYLDPLALEDRQMWEEMVLREFESAADEFADKFGEHFFDLAIWPQVLNATLMGVFVNNLPEIDRVKAVGSIAAIGYQLGNLNDCGKCLDDLLIQLAALEIVKTPETNEETNQIKGVVGGILCGGAYWKTTISEDAPSKEDMPKSFRKFIENNPKFDGFN